ncbi:hypothetical protein C8J56DRAFT_342229 [Mycena floridula]|nr:hypothetical protein C8J56DRAFT_342229 [Mycena floridula]
MKFLPGAVVSLISLTHPTIICPSFKWYLGSMLFHLGICTPKTDGAARCNAHLLVQASWGQVDTRVSLVHHIWAPKDHVDILLAPGLLPRQREEMVVHVKPRTSLLAPIPPLMTLSEYSYPRALSSFRSRVMTLDPGIRTLSDFPSSSRASFPETRTLSPPALSNSSSRLLRFLRWQTPPVAVAHQTLSPKFGLCCQITEARVSNRSQCLEIMTRSCHRKNLKTKTKAQFTSFRMKGSI